MKKQLFTRLVIYITQVQYGFETMLTTINWLYQMWTHLHEEFQLRYGKDHKSYTLLKDLLKNPPKNIPLNIPFNQPTQAMPDDVKNEDSIIAYRDYYVKYKKDFATWKTSIPEWYSEGINANI